MISQQKFDILTLYKYAINQNYQKDYTIMKNKVHVKIDAETSVIMLLTGYGILSVIAFNIARNLVIMINTLWNERR